MSSILKIVNQLYYFVLHIPGVINFLIFTFPDFVKRGKISIETAIQDPSNKNEFRTIIQLDADVISFIPDPDIFSNGKLYDEKYQEHKKKVTDMLTKLDGINTFIAFIGAIISIVTLILNYYVGRERSWFYFIMIILIFILIHVLRRRWFIFKLLFFVFPRSVNLVYSKLKDNIPGS